MMERVLLGDDALIVLISNEIIAKIDAPQTVTCTSENMQRSSLKRTFEMLCSQGAARRQAEQELLAITARVRAGRERVYMALMGHQ